MKSLPFLISMSLLLFMGLSNCTTIFNATFNDQAVGPPSSIPPGNPSGDAMAFSNGVSIVGPGIFSSNALKIERENRGTHVDFVADVHRNTNHYTVLFQGYIPAGGNASHLTMKALGNGNSEAFHLKMSGGQIHLLSGAGEELIGNYVPNQIYTFILGINVTPGSTAVSIDIIQSGTSIVSVSGKPLINAAFDTFEKFRMEFPIPTVEALPGIFVADEITIMRKKESGEE